jgi:hypothetical protein
VCLVSGGASVVAFVREKVPSSVEVVKDTAGLVRTRSE